MKQFLDDLNSDKLHRGIHHELDVSDRVSTGLGHCNGVNIKSGQYYTPFPV